MNNIMKLKYFYNKTKVFFGQDARYKILEGINILNKATQKTLGPKVQNNLFIG